MEPPLGCVQRSGIPVIQTVVQFVIPAAADGEPRLRMVRNRLKGPGSGLRSGFAGLSRVCCFDESRPGPDRQVRPGRSCGHGHSASTGQYFEDGIY